MPKPVDATLKALLEESPISWPELFGLPARAAVVDADTSTVSGGADKVLRVTGPPDWIMHIEFQSGPDTTLPQRLHLDNALLADRHGLEVQSALVLLTSKAHLRTINGVYERRFAGEMYLTFRYRVLRVWEMPVATLLAGGPSLLPLAPISNVRREHLPGVVERIKEQLAALPAPESAKLWTATYVLVGLRYSHELAAQLLEGVKAMKESSTYQAIIEEGIEKGAVSEARKFFLRLAKKRLGAPPAEVLIAVDAIADVERLEELGELFMEVRSWDEALPMLTARPRRRRRS